MFPGLPGNRGTRQRLSASRRGDFFVPGTVLPGAGASKLAIQAGFRPPFACPVQPLKAAPRSGHGRLPKAPRVCVCETQPRAPHRPVWVSPFQPALALPHFRTPHEAPLIGQDASRISEGLGTGIGIHSHFRERRFSCPGRSAARRSSRRGALQSRGRTEHRRLVRSRFCEAPLRKSYALHRAHLRLVTR